MPANTPNNLPYPLGTDFVVDGDNAIANLARAIRICGGTAVIPAPTGGAVFVNIPITFPVGLFTAAPVVIATGVNNTSSTAIVVAIAQGIGISTTGCTLRAVLSTGATWGTAYTAQWFAYQLNPIAGALTPTQLPGPSIEQGLPEPEPEPEPAPDDNEGGL